MSPFHSVISYILLFINIYVLYSNGARLIFTFVPNTKTSAVLSIFCVLNSLNIIPPFCLCNVESIIFSLPISTAQSFASPFPEGKNGIEYGGILNNSASLSTAFSDSVRNQNIRSPQNIRFSQIPSRSVILIFSLTDVPPSSLR